MFSPALIIFVKNSIPGQVKTRLAAEVGEKKALDIYERLLQHTLQVTRHLPVTKYIYYSDTIPVQDIWSDQLYQKRVQSGDDLGERMNHALQEVLQKHPGAVLIGSDVANLDSETLLDAFDALNYVDVVIGPAQDGGYYLIGSNVPQPQLFDDIAWSTSSVYQKTLLYLIQHCLDFKILPLKTDIDTVRNLVDFGWLA